jgi:hypothetical protein
MRATLKKALWVYVALALLTLIFQVYVRIPQCSGNECAASLGKAVVWSVIWPASWIVYLR